jgi:hypothetical protein
MSKNQIFSRLLPSRKSQCTHPLKLKLSQSLQSRQGLAVSSKTTRPSGPHGLLLGLKLREDTMGETKDTAPVLLTSTPRTHPTPPVLPDSRLKTSSMNTPGAPPPCTPLPSPRRSWPVQQLIPQDCLPTLPRSNVQSLGRITSPASCGWDHGRNTSLDGILIRTEKARMRMKRRTSPWKPCTALQISKM